MNPDKNVKNIFLPIIIFIALSIFTAGSLFGDIIHFKNGKTLEGKVLKKDDKVVEFKTKFGTIKIERSRIEKIEIKTSVEEIFMKKVEELDHADAESIFELAMWCKENGKKKESRKYLKEAIKVDNQHDGANKEMGNVLLDGKWFNANELNKYKSAKAKRMKAQGYVLHNGQWAPESEVRREMGYVEWEGKWISRMEEYHHLGDRDIEKIFGYPMKITDSKHFTIRSKNGTEDYHQELLEYCELELDHFLMTFKPIPVESRIMLYYPIPIYILEDIDACALYIDSGYIKRYNPPKEELERYAPKTNFSIYFPRPLVVLSEGRHLVGADDRHTSQIGFMSHHLGHILIRRFKRGGKVPGWVETGIAHYYEGMTNFHYTLSVCEYRGYEDVEKWTSGWGNFKVWQKKLIDAKNHATLPTVKQLFALNIEKMNSMQMAKAWSVTTFLLEKYQTEFVWFIRRYFDNYRGEKKIGQERAWEIAFDKITPQQIEKEWRNWIVQQPPTPQRRDKLNLVNPDGK